MSVCGYPAHTFADHHPTLSPITADGDNKHVSCGCADMFAYLADWLDHANAETTRAER